MKYPCPCCGYKTFNNPPDGTYAICAVCYWEDDPVQLKDPNYEGGANSISLKQAQKNFLEFGASRKEMVRCVRPPMWQEQRDESWKPFENH